MKRVLIAMLGTVILTTAHAQFTPTGLNGLVLDSTYTTSVDGLRLYKTAYEYNSDKSVTAITDYSYPDGIATPSERTVFTYNGDKCCTLEEKYKYDESGEPVLYSYSEMSDWDKNSRQPGTIMAYSLDEEYPEAGFQLMYKQEIYYDGTGLPTDYHLYMSDGEDWFVVGKGNMEYENGLCVSESSTLDMDGYSNISETTYEYDSHGQVNKRTETNRIVLFGTDMTTTTVYTLENEYYEDGNLKKVTESEASDSPDNEGVTTMEYYFWGNGNTTLIRAIEAAKKNAGIYFDLSGRSHNGTPTEKGIYIINGKKTVIE